MPELLKNVILFILLAVCLFTDLKERKIYNKFTVPVLLLGIVIGTAAEGFSGLKTSLAGLGTGLAIMLLPYLAGGLGAGDVKLLMAIGALKGPYFTFESAIATFIAGGVIAALIITVRGNWKDSLRRITLIFLTLSIKSKKNTSTVINTGPKFPYGVAIIIGTLIIILKGG